MIRCIVPIYLAALVAISFCNLTVAADEQPAATQSQTAARVTETDDAILIYVDDKPVLQYNKTNTQLPEGIEDVFARSGYIHPIHSPSGRVVTGHYAADHPHQTGLFNAWVDANFRGHTVDFWNIKKGLGRVAHDKVLFTRNHADRAEFSVQLIHEDISDPEAPVTVLNETWNIAVHTSTQPGYIIDVVSTQTCATSDPLTINEYRYGGMAIRGCDDWYSDASGAAVKAYTKELQSDPDAAPPRMDTMNHEFITSESKGRFDGNHSRPNWVDLHGVVEGKMAGIAILNHNENFRSPQSVRLNPSKPYFCFAPNVIGAFQIKPGEDFVSKYRLVIHDGPPEPRQLDDEWSRLNSATESN